MDRDSRERTAGGAPAVVREMAGVLPDQAIARRLLDDPRMASVWRELRRVSLGPEVIDRLGPLERLADWDISERGVSFSDQACAGLFAFAVIEFSQWRPIGTLSDADAKAEPYFSAARMCRDLLFQPPYPTRAEAEALQQAARYIENYVGWQLDHLKSSPYTIGERSSKGKKRQRNDEDRARARVLALRTYAIFGKRLNGTVALMATVALQTSKTITKRDVINWTASMKLPIERTVIAKEAEQTDDFYSRFPYAARIIVGGAN